MRPLSIRSKILLRTLVFAGTAVVLILAAQHTRARTHLARQLERTLATKCEEIHSLLESSVTTVDLQTFLEVETRYLSSPYEYFYEIVDARAARLMSSRNLGAARLVRTPVDGMLTLDHPLKQGERLRVLSEPLLHDVPDWDGAHLAIGVSLAPLDAAVRSDLLQAGTMGAGGLLVLAATLWFAVGGALRRVAAITRRAATITSTNLRERLPVSGDGDELDELAHVFNAMLDRIGRALEQMESFTADAAHQLRTPLTRVRGELDLMLRGTGQVPEALRPRLEDVREELERLARTCSRLLLLARLDRGRLEEELTRDEIDLGRTVDDLVEQVRPLAGERDVEIVFEPLADVRLRVSHPLIVEALLNLLDNALKASPRGARVDVRLERAGERVLVTISDQGPGIRDDLREQVFRRFFRHSADPLDGGTGLGLAIVRGIARAHGGDVRVESGRTCGATLVFELPLAPAPLIGFSPGTQPTLNRAG